MGQKRIKLVDLAAQEEQKPSSAKATKGKKTKAGKKGRKVIRAGKGEHGRLADMTIMPEEAEKVEKVVEVAKVEKVEKEKRVKKKRPKKVRSKRYRELKAKIEPGKQYPLKIALPLLLEMSNSHFDESVELHLVMKKPGPKTEKKFPLIHQKIGKVSEGEKKLLKKLEHYLESLKNQQIRKAVLTSTMSPGIKLNVEQLQKTS